MKLLVVLLVTATAMLAGCGVGDDPGNVSNEDARAHVEQMIRSQLPGSVKRNTGEAVFVSSVTCVREDESHFDCIAKVGGTDGAGGLEYLDIGVSATCDEANCTWRTQ